MSLSRKKILFVCTEDWFFKSHFMPLSEAAILGGGYDAAVVTTTNGASEELERLGLKIVPVDFERSNLGARTMIKLLWRLIVQFRRERPDAIHFIAHKPIFVGGLAAFFVPKAAVIFHLTGLGFLAADKSRRAKIIRSLFLGSLSFYLKRRKSWLIVENPDDLENFKHLGPRAEMRTSIFGGAGVDPEKFAEQPIEEHKFLRVAYVGRIVWSKGLDILIESLEVLAKRGTKLELDIFGATDVGNPRALQAKTLQEWNRLPGVTVHGATSDVPQVWRSADIAVFPSRGGEGLPRAVLEAAACGRPLVVTDVPGCRHFVRHGIEGLIVPPEDHVALADAIEKLAHDPNLCRRMGQAGHQRVLDGYTENHVREDVLKIYNTLLRTEK